MPPRCRGADTMGMVAPVYYTADMVRALSATTASASGGCTKSVESQAIGLSTARSAGSRFGRRPPNFRPWSGSAWCGTPQAPERRSVSSSASCSGRSDGRCVLDYGTACHHCIDLRDRRHTSPHQWRDTTIGSHGGCRQDGVLRGRARLSISARAEPGTRHRLGGLLRLGVPRRVHNLGTAKSAIPDMARALRALVG